ncbi:MAG TPA: hypothetical protein PLF88_11265 [Opitutaceae bacterium]|nr:hypothetical protein [Opitutaceae bacterium]HRJ46401.1 hypothetical protein [Opitutaceae bacterium]
MQLIHRYVRALLIGVGATPAAALAGAILMFVAVWVTQQEVTLLVAPFFIYIGVVFGSWHAAPVMLGVLPALAAAGLLREGRGPMCLWLGLAAVIGAFRMYAIEPETMAGEDPVGWAVILAGGAGGLTGGLVFLLARRWIRRERVPVSPPH